MKTILTILVSIIIFFTLYKFLSFIFIRRLKSYSKIAEYRRQIDQRINEEIQKDRNFYGS